MANIASLTMKIHELVSELTQEDRRRVFGAVGTLCGDDEIVPRSPVAGSNAEQPPDGLPLRASRWLSQNQIPRERIEEIFHLDGPNVDLLLVDVPGRSKREQTINCYLLLGIRSLLATGEPTVVDADVVALCKQHKCHDVANHASYRKQIANLLAGDKAKGYVLSAPGLRTAAEIIRIQK